MDEGWGEEEEWSYETTSLLLPCSKDTEPMILQSLLDTPTKGRMWGTVAQPSTLETREEKKNIDKFEMFQSSF